MAIGKKADVYIFDLHICTVTNEANEAGGISRSYDIVYCYKKKFFVFKKIKKEK